MKDLFPVLFPFILVGWFIFINQIMGKTGGWGKLASHYRMDRLFEGTLLKGRACSLGNLRYSGIVNLGANREGLYLSMSFIFRVGHPPLLISWNEMTVSEQRYFFRDLVVLGFTRIPGVVLKLRKKDILELRESSDIPFFSAIA